MRHLYIAIFSAAVCFIFLFVFSGKRIFFPDK